MKILGIFGVTLLLLFLLAPVTSLVVAVWVSDTTYALWPTLWYYAPNTVLLCLLVMMCAWIFGVIPAYLLTMFEFPCSRWLGPLLVLPFAIPAYLLAYIYGDLFEYAGIVQNLYRALFDYSSAREYHFFDIRSLGGLGLLMGIGLAPYIYVFTAAALRKQGRNLYETSRMLGASHVYCFCRVIVPISRPAWSAGLALVCMETIAEFGAVEHFGVQTLTLGIYIHWLQLSDWVIAARLALVGGVVVIMLNLWERLARGQRGYFHAITSKPQQGIQPPHLAGWLMCLICLAPLIIGFVIPVSFLSVQTAQHISTMLSADFYQALLNTLLLASSTTLIACLLAFILVLVIPTRTRLKPYLGLLNIGYMLPGTIFALGMMLWLAQISTLINNILGLAVLLVGTHFGLIYAYLGRFLTISHGIMREGIESVPQSLHDATRLFHVDIGTTWWRVKLPLMRPHMLAALLIVFVECIKELPMTLIMRPIGIETLASDLYQYAGDENLPEAAPRGLLIALCGIIPIWLLQKFSQTNKPRSGLS